MTFTRRHGTTLVEVLVFGAIGTMVLASVWGLLVTGLRRGARTQTKVRGVEAALFASARLEADLRAAAAAHAGHEVQVETRDDGVLLRFARFGEDRPEASWDLLDIQPVAWFWERDTHRLMRKLADGDVEVLPGRFATFEAHALVGDEDAAPTPGAGPLLEYRLLGTSTEWLGSPEERRHRPGGTEVRGAVSLTTRLRVYGYPHHSRIPYGNQETS
jgi:hypothetical protein